MTALAISPAPAPTSPPAPAAVEPAPVEPARDYLVRIDVGPELARRMGIRVIVRPAGDNFGNRRGAAAIDLPRPITPDLAPGPASARLPAGEWTAETSAPGFLPSTRKFTVDAEHPEQTLRWLVLPDSTHTDVRFPISAAGAPGVALTVRSADGATTWSCTSQRTPCTLRLARGEWTVEARANGFRTATRSFTVATTASQTVELQLVAGKDDDLAPGTGPLFKTPPADRRRLALGLGITAAPVFAAGVGLAVAGRLQYVGTLRGDSCDGAFGPVCANAVVGPVHRASAGFGMLGAAVGLLATSATAAFPVSRQTWWIELGVGGALTAAGAGWMIANTVTLDRALHSGPLVEVAGRSDRRFGASVVVGLGAGATLGALTGLLLHRRASRIAPYAAPGQAGLVWAGRF